MLYSTVTPAAEKRAAVRERLAPASCLPVPGRVQPAVARLIGKRASTGVYISGAVLAADLGLPDIGLTTLTEVATGAGRSPG